MKYNRFFISAVALLCLQNAAYAEPGYKDKNLPVETRVADLLSRMTLDEKILQLTQYTLGTNNNPNNIGEAVEKVPAEVGSVIYFDSDAQTRNSLQKKAVEETRLGIPVLFGYDVIHGFRTVFAVPLAQACTWNPELVRQGAQVAAQESRMSGVDWTFSPMIDVARDGRWGRIMEGYGEDPYATSVYTVAAVKGYQGENLSDSHSIAACLKHFVGYGASEAGRDYVYTEISAQTLWDTYLPPYEAGVKAGAATLMSAFNDISGVPASANYYTLTEILKERWGHEGFVVSDWDSVVQLVLQGVAKDEKEAAEKALMAGVEMDMNDGAYFKYLAELVAEGKVPVSRIDDAVSRILRVKFQLGLFENPYTEELPEAERLMLPESLKVVERLAEETMVLLKNEDRVLPLKSGSKIALVGPLAKSQEDLLGSWSAHGRASDVTTLYDAIADEFGKDNILYAKGCSFEDSSAFEEAINIAQKSDVIVACLGEPRSWSGENTSRTTIAVPDVQVELLKQLKTTGKKIVVVLSNGRPLDLSKLEPLADAILEIWQPGIPGGRPAAGALSGRVNPSGKLAVTFPYSTGQIPIYYNRRKPARLPEHGLYKDMTSEPLYSFGYGLSYSDFEYGKVSLSKNVIKKGEGLTARITVANTGNVDGAETVMWYISDPYCSISRPVMELKHFEKKNISAGGSTVYEFEIDPERDFSYVDSNGVRFLEAGDYYLIVNGEKYKIELQD